MQKRLTATLIALFVLLAPIAIAERPAEASPADSYSGPYFGAGNLPPGCVADMSKPAPANLCHHMRTDLNALDSPKVDVLVMVPVSPTAERDMRIMRQSVEMWEGGIDSLAQEMGLDWLEQGMDFHVSVDYFDPAGGEGGEFTTYPIVDPEIVVIATNPVGGAGIGIDPVDFVFTNENQVPCHNVENPFDFEHWENLPGFDSHHESRSGTYVEDCDGKGGNICFAINGAIDPDPSVIDFFGLFDLVSHEFGHCLTLGHVGDGAEGAWGVVPTNDIMAYSQDPVDRTKCVSTLDVESVALRMSKYLDVNGDAAVDNGDLLAANDPNGVGDPLVGSTDPFQVQHPDDHLYASSSGDPYDCPQPDVGPVPGPRTDWTPEPDGGTDPDVDRDGIPDATDNCPNVVNPGQQDSDSDGAGDACESGPRAFYMDGTNPFGELDQPPGGGYLELNADPGSEEKSMMIPNYVGGPNTNCAGNSLFPVFVGEVAGRLVGDMEVAFPAIASGGRVEIRVWPDVTSQQCNAAYPEPAGSVEVALPSGEGTVQATIPDLDFVADSTVMIQITPVLASGPAYARAFYGTSASSTTFCLIPTGASGDGCGATDPDSDADGVPDLSDNCPDVTNPGQEDGDGDGTGDACETSEPDADSDGVPDAEDNCPDDANPGQEDSDGDGTGDACESTGPGEVIYEESGRIAASNPASGDVGGTTQNEYLFWCDGLPPFSQGVDGHVFLIEDEIPESTLSTIASGNATASLVGSESPIGHDLDMYFYSGDCTSLGQKNTADPDETGQIPAGTRFIIANAWLGADTLATLTITSGDGTGPVDTDGDGVPDDSDNCPEVANADQADADGDGVGDACDAPEPAGTTVAFTSGSAGQYGDDATIAAQLFDEDGTAISGAQLDFELSGSDANSQPVSVTWSATTGDGGVASANRTLTHDAGMYNLTVHYAGQQDTYEPSSDQTTFLIDPEATVTTLDVTGKGKGRTITATLAEDDGATLDRMLVFYATGADGVRREIRRAATENGTVSFTAPQGYRGDHFDFEAVFEGERNYAGSSAHHQT